MVIRPIARLHDGQRQHGFLAQHQDVERVSVFGKSPRNKAVIGGIEHGRVEYAIHSNQTAVLVELILHVRAERNLNHGVEFAGRIVSGRDVVPWMRHGI
jgi:hypothetical protein